MGARLILVELSATAAICGTSAASGLALPSPSASPFGSRGCGSKDRFDVVRRKNSVGDIVPAFRRAKPSMASLVAVNRPKDPLQFGWRRLGLLRARR